MFRPLLVTLLVLALAVSVLAQSNLPPNPPLPQERLEVRSLRISPDGRLLATGVDKFKRDDKAPGYVANEAQIWVWNIGDGGLKWKRTLPGGSNPQVEFSPDGKKLLGHIYTSPTPKNENAPIRTQTTIWDTAHGKHIATLETDTRGYSLVPTFIDNGNQLAANSSGTSYQDSTYGSPTSTLQTWDAQTGKFLRVLSHGFADAGPATSSLNGKWLISNRKYEGEVNHFYSETTVWELPAFRIYRQFPTSENVVSKIVISPDGLKIATITYSSDSQGLHEVIKIHGLDGLAPAIVSAPFAIRQDSLEFSSDSQALVGSSIAPKEAQKKTRLGWIGFWNTRTGDLERTVNLAQIGESSSFLARLMPDGKSCITTTGDNKAQLRRLEDGRIIREFEVFSPSHNAYSQYF